MPRPIGQLDRVLDTLTIGLLTGKEKRDAQLAFSATREVEQQVRVPLSGDAGNGWGFVDQAVNWELPFIYAPAQRDSNFPTPHFSYGVVLGSGTANFVDVRAQVLTWSFNDSSWVIGAMMRFASSAPMLEGEETVPYSAIAHLTFQGYAALTDEPETAMQTPEGEGAT